MLSLMVKLDTGAYSLIVCCADRGTHPLRVSRYFTAACRVLPVLSHRSRGELLDRLRTLAACVLFVALPNTLLLPLTLSLFPLLSHRL